MEQILRKGRTKGFVTFPEILYFSNIEDSISELEDLLTMFENSGIDVKESRVIWRREELLKEKLNLLEDFLVLTLFKLT